MVCDTKTFTPKRKEHKFMALKNRNLKTESKEKANIHKTLFKFKKIFDKSRIELLVKIFKHFLKILKTSLLLSRSSVINEFNVTKEVQFRQTTKSSIILKRAGSLHSMFVPMHNGRMRQTCVFQCSSMRHLLRHAISITHC